VEITNFHKEVIKKLLFIKVLVRYPKNCTGLDAMPKNKINQWYESCNKESSRKKRLRQVKEAEAQQERRIETFRNSKKTLCHVGFQGKETNLSLVIMKKAKSLNISQYEKPFHKLHRLRYKWTRNPDEWVPKGKSRSKLFRGVCEHLFAKYPMKGFIWSGFMDEAGFVNSDLKPQKNPNLVDGLYGDDDDDELKEYYTHCGRVSDIITDVANGASLYKTCKAKGFPVELTKAQCHEFLNSPIDMGFMEALRTVQVRSLGGSRSLLNEWMKLEQGRYLADKKGEEFNLTMLRFFAQNPMLDNDQIAPLVDYVKYRVREDKDFSMKGRSVAAMLRGMYQWHGDIYKFGRVKNNAKYLKSGFKEATYDTSLKDAKGNTWSETWTFTEVLSSQELFNEGKAMHHCAFSYTWAIERGRTSIWSLSCESDFYSGKMLTIEVNNDAGKIVQKRGKSNRVPTSKEDKVIIRWAEKNNLTIGYNCW